MSLDLQTNNQYCSV